MGRKRGGILATHNIAMPITGDAGKVNRAIHTQYYSHMKDLTHLNGNSTTPHISSTKCIFHQVYNKLHNLKTYVR